MLSAFAAPASSRELCKDDKFAGEQAAQEKQDEERACALPVPAEGQAAGSGGYLPRASAGAINAMPLLAGLATLAGLTAYVLSQGDNKDRINLPISPA